MIENLDNVIDFIILHNLISKGDRVGIGVSGGSDSMALLHFMNDISAQAGFEIIAVHVNHGIRQNARKDAQFVSNYCKENKIEYLGLSVDVPTFATQNKMGLEQAARIKRYEAFQHAIKKANLNKFATAHHQGDQAETILMHIFRGSGIGGASGMTPSRGIFIRPFLETPKADIIAYNYRMQVPNIEDETNQDNTFRRNFLRNEIMSRLTQEWRNVEKAIIDFGRNCRIDDSYLNSLVDTRMFQVSDNIVRIPLNLLVYSPAVTNRVILAGFEKLQGREGIERKHLELVAALAQTGENGSRTDLPGGIYAIREYEYLALVRKQTCAQMKIYSFKIGKTHFAEYGTISVTKTISFKDVIKKQSGEPQTGIYNTLVIDVDKLPRTSKWRTRKEGDIFTKFGGGTKPLSSVFIDKKIPIRLRDKIPVLAAGNEIFAIAGIEISDNVRVDSDTVEAYICEFVRD